MTAEMNKSKQEVFDELQKAHPTSIPVFKAMDSWARQVSIAFAEWVEKNYSFSFGSWEAIDPITTRTVLPHVEYTIDQLFNLFLSQYNKEGQ